MLSLYVFHGYLGLLDNTSSSPFSAFNLSETLGEIVSKHPSKSINSGEKYDGMFLSHVRFLDPENPFALGKQRRNDYLTTMFFSIFIIFTYILAYV